jgi:hypothetical protein
MSRSSARVGHGGLAWIIAGSWSRATPGRADRAYRLAADVQRLDVMALCEAASRSP